MSFLPFSSGMLMDGKWAFVCRDMEGNERWRDRIENLITDEGCNHALEIVLANGTQKAEWFIGLAAGGLTPAAGDTLASHAGWTEVTNYSEGERQAWTPGAVSGKSVDNTGSPASFSINATSNIGGAFLCSVNTGTSGVLYAVGALTGGARVLGNGDTITINSTFNAADDGA